VDVDVDATSLTYHKIFEYKLTKLIQFGYHFQGLNNQNGLEPNFVIGYGFSLNSILIQNYLQYYRNA
jgi:hypothetical protein